MHEIFTVIGIIIFGMALRSCKCRAFRKLGMLCYLSACGVALYFMTGSWIAAAVGALAWFFLPWIELLIRVRKLQLPVENKLSLRKPPCDSYFPEAQKLISDLEEKGYEHISDSGWQWDKSTQYYSFFWHPEDKHLAAVCHCVQSCVSFCYMTITSESPDGTIWRSTNYPFSPTLAPVPKIKWNHICTVGMNSLEHMLYAHNHFLYRQGQETDKLTPPNPEQVEQHVEGEMRQQIDHNLKKGLIRLTGDGHFKYSFKGLFFLWKQILKDMIRLC